MAIPFSSLKTVSPDGKSPLGAASSIMGQVMKPRIPGVGRIPGMPAQPGGMPNVGAQPAQPTVPQMTVAGGNVGSTGVKAPANAAAPAPLPLPLPIQSPNAAITRIDPANDLRSTMIAPTAGPSRSQIALDRLKSFDMDTADERARGIRDIGRSAAKFGRLGSSMVSTDLGSLEERLARAREQMLLNLSANTAEGEIGDARMDRGELRGERNFQVDRADNAIDRNVQQRFMEDALVNSQFNRDRVLANAELDLAQGAEANSQGAFGSLAELFKNRAAGQLPGSVMDVLGSLGGAAPPTTLPPVASAPNNKIPTSVLPFSSLKLAGR